MFQKQAFAHIHHASLCSHPVGLPFTLHVLCLIVRILKFLLITFLVYFHWFLRIMCPFP